MRIARRAGYKRMAWKNGKGLTEEVAAFPHGSDVENFEWRISIAHVEADGPFSVFAGIDRTIALLNGPGLTLHLPEDRAVELLPGSTPFSFPGEWEISSSNTGGPTIDLNIMTRRGSCSHGMERRVLAPDAEFSATGSGWAVFNTPARIEADGKRVSLERFDALTLGANEGFVNRTAAPVEILFAQISPMRREASSL